MSPQNSRPRRGRPVGAGQSFNSTLSIVVAVVAVLIGYLILNDLSGDSSSSGPKPGSTTTTTAAGATTTSTTIPSTTGFKVQVANASGIAQSAAKLGQQLAGRGYIVQPAKNSSDATPKQTVTKVLYIAGAEAQAQAISAVLGGKPIEPMPAVIPTDDGSIGEASVLIMLGTDLANKQLPTTVNTQG